MYALYISNYRNNIDRRGKKINPLRQLSRKLLGTKISGQDGFFFGSLHTVFKVEENTLSYLAQNPKYVNKKFDVLFLNYFSGIEGRINSGGDNRIISAGDIEFLSKITIPKILVVTNELAGDMPENSLLDHFDLIFKREHYSDLDRYPISSKNKDKIRTTMLCCPFVSVTSKNAAIVKPSSLGFQQASTHFTHDCFFIGKSTNQIRLSVLQHLHRCDFRLLGGLFPHKKYHDRIPPVLLAKHLNRKKYIDAIRRSKICLGLDGYGEYTFRHNEVLFLCSFLLSTSTIRGIKLPISIIEDRHYVCFENLDDLVDKVNYYLDHDDERIRIAQAGRYIFESEYDFNKHGRYIKRSVFGQ